MKLPELVKRFEKKYRIRIVAGVLVVALIGTSVSAYDVHGARAAGTETEQSTGQNTQTGRNTEQGEKTEQNTEQEAGSEEEETADLLRDKLGDALDHINIEEKTIGKEETVYVIADSNGKAKEIIVSDHLHNEEGAKTIEDVSTLRDIENVKGDETFHQSGDQLTWQADGNDIYYQGTSTKELPVSQQITYFLDGEERKPEEMAGKSGEVTIRFSYTNNESVKTKIDGAETEVYVPFVAVSGMVLNENFTHVKVSNGKVVEDGTKTLVVGYALPGLKESLAVEDEDFDNDVTIPQYLEVTADVEYFELGMTMTVVANAMDFLNMNEVSDFSDADELVDTLTDAVGQLQVGSGALAEGTDTLRDKMGEFADGVSTLRKGVSDYTDGVKRLADGISTFKSSVPTLSNGVTTLNSSAASISEGVALLDRTLNTAFTDKEKKDMTKAVAETLAKQEKNIKKSAAESIKAQENSIKNQAEAAVDAQAEGIKTLAEGSVDAQAAGIKAQAEGSVDAQAAGIKAQAEGTVDAQADTIKAQAEGTVDAQAEGIKAQAEAGVTAQADAIKNAASAGVAAQKETLENAAAASVQQKAEEIKNQAQAGVNAQAAAIQAAAVDTVNQTFAAQNYASIKGQAQQSFSEKMTNCQ